MKTSVALCTYNGERFIREQIDSILNQTQSVDEIVVCDDGSTDKTLDILEQYAIDNLNLFRIYKNEVNLRSVKNFEKAISLCSNEVIFLCDQDDKWESTKVKAFCSHFESHPEINVIASNGYCINENSERQQQNSLWDIPEYFKSHIIDFDYFKMISCVGNIATGASMAVRKSFAEKVIPFPVIQFFHHDEWIAATAAASNSFILLNEKYFNYRSHSNQQVGSVFLGPRDKDLAFIAKVYNFHLQLTDFRSLKMQQKKLCDTIIKNKTLADSKNEFSHLFANNIEAIRKKYNDNVSVLKRKYFLKYTLQSLADKIKNKRQFKP